VQSHRRLYQRPGLDPRNRRGPASSHSLGSDVIGIPTDVAAANIAFGVVFGAFVIALVALIVITLRWAIRRDRVGRAEWIRRRTEGDLGAADAPSGPVRRTRARRAPGEPGGEDP